MTSSLPRILLALALSLAAWLSVPAGAHAFTIGISEQKTGMWQDPRFQALEIKQARILMSYDSVLAGDFSRYAQWMKAAQARGADVLLTINHSSSNPTVLPSLADYRRVVQILRQQYPWVKSMSAWNEANHVMQPTSRKPKRAAQFYNIMREECVGCNVVAADVLDVKNMLPWLKKFKRYAKNPRIWGLHSYADANHFRKYKISSTKKLLKTVKGKVWLTEAGGIVQFSDSFPGGSRGEARAAKAVKATFKIARKNHRIKRVYLYHWDADPTFVTWDSAFIASNGRARPSLEILRKEINRQRKLSKPRLPALPALPAYAASTLPLP